MKPPQRVLITGGTGFIGSCLVERLSHEPVQVGVVVRSGSNRWRIPHLPSNAVELQADLLDGASVDAAVRAFAPDAVVHLAWSGVGNRFRNDSQQIAANVMPAVALLESARDAGCRVWIGLGSQAEYGPRAEPIDEAAPSRPTTLYGAAKLATAILTERLAEQSQMRWVWARIFSSYGPKDDPEWMIPYLIRQLLQRSRPSLTKGEQLWDYLHVSDVSEALVRLLFTERAVGVFNIGSGVAVPLRRIIESIRDRIDPALPLGFGDIPYRPDQVMRLQACVDKLKEVTGWAPAISLEDGLRSTVDWYREHEF